MNDIPLVYALYKHSYSTELRISTAADVFRHNSDSLPVFVLLLITI